VGDDIGYGATCDTHTVVVQEQVAPKCVKESSKQRCDHRYILSVQPI